ncbi:cytochrome P450 [Streptomyces somaliensis]|uniref:cytochrome P450 n=1 Tax=Streptomyces somaliensis TaxID=78355 RepID=UPI0034E979BF|nr:cytochrome P450 [Streptomyces somaliensis]
MRRTLPRWNWPNTSSPRGAEAASEPVRDAPGPRHLRAARRLRLTAGCPSAPRRSTSSPTSFGAGSRKCIGDSFSWTQATIVLATVLQRWRLRPAPGHTPKAAAAAMAHPDHVPMIVSAREG